MLPVAASTNRLAWQIADEQLPALIVCEQQSAGRGRHNRIWSSVPGKSLTFSLAFGVPNASLSGLSLVAAAALASALRSSGCNVALKWPNDLLDAAGRKLAGILTETSIKRCRAVLGVGINLHAPVPSQASWLYRYSQPLERNLLLAELAGTLLAALTIWRRQGWAALRADWLAYSAHALGDAMLVSTGAARKQRMYFAGLGLHGELLAHDAAGALHTICTGEVSIDVSGD